MLVLIDCNRHIDYFNKFGFKLIFIPTKFLLPQRLKTPLIQKLHIGKLYVFPYVEPLKLRLNHSIIVLFYQ